MQKILTIFLVSLALCLIIGFVGTLLLYPRPNNPNFKSPSAVVDGEINNIIIIHVDNLASPKPELISLWAVIIKRTDKLHFFFDLLSPQISKNQSEDLLLNSFQINQNLELSESFIQTLPNVPDGLRGYILVDNASINKFLLSAGFALPPFNSTPAQTSEQTKKIIKSETEFFFLLCKHPSKILAYANQQSAPFLADPFGPILLNNIRTYVGSQQSICEIEDFFDIY